MARTPLNVRIDPALLTQVRRLADSQNRTLSNLVDTALKTYVETSKKTQPLSNDTREAHGS